MQLNQVTLPALDIPSAIQFYLLLGFELIVETEHYARFCCPKGGATLSVHKIDITALPNMNMNTNTIIYFEDDNLDATVQALQQRGVVFIQEPRDEEWLWREARLQDPSGNMLCLYYAGENRLNPPWRVCS